MTNLNFSFILHAKKGVFCFILLLSCIPTFFMISFALIWKVITFFKQHFLYLPLSSFFSCFYFRASAPTLDLFLLKLSPPFLLIVLFSSPALIPCLFFFFNILHFLIVFTSRENNFFHTARLASVVVTICLWPFPIQNRPMPLSFDTWYA